MMPHYMSMISANTKGWREFIRSREPGIYGIHKNMWKFFPGPIDSRKFLFHIMYSEKSILCLSEIRPVSPNDNWTIDVKEYEPSVNVGDYFKFRTRVNPTITRNINGKHKRHDVVMDAKLNSIDQSSMIELIEISVGDWIKERGVKNGFAVHGDSLCIHSYERHESSKSPNEPIVFSTVDIEGYLEVTNVEKFMNVIHHGLGPCKSFGCGLIVIKRV